jgi:hypothetical protein
VSWAQQAVFGLLTWENAANRRLPPGLPHRSAARGLAAGRFYRSGSEGEQAMFRRFRPSFGGGAAVLQTACPSSPEAYLSFHSSGR